MSGVGKGERSKALELNLLILLGYRNAVTSDTALPLRTMLEIAGDPLQTDGEAYSGEEVQTAVASLLEDELIRIVKVDFDATEITAYATGFHPDHRFYVTPMGILSVKKLIDDSGGK